MGGAHEWGPGNIKQVLTDSRELDMFEKSGLLELLGGLWWHAMAVSRGTSFVATRASFKVQVPPFHSLT